MSFSFLNMSCFLISILVVSIPIPSPKDEIKTLLPVVAVVDEIDVSSVPLSMVTVAWQRNIPIGRSLHADRIHRRRRHLMDAATSGHRRYRFIPPARTATGKAAIRRRRRRRRRGGGSGRGWIWQGRWRRCGRDLVRRSRRRKEGSDLQRQWRRRCTVVFLDEIGEILVGSDGNQSVEVFGR